MGVNGKLYIIGGFVEGWTPTDEVHEYNRRAIVGSALRPCPHREARWRPPYSMARSTRPGIGWRGRNSAAHEVYDPAANRWTALAYVPTARDHLAVAAVGGRLYAVAGRINGNYSRNLTPNEANSCPGPG